MYGRKNKCKLDAVCSDLIAFIADVEDGLEGHASEAAVTAVELYPNPREFEASLFNTLLT